MSRANVGVEARATHRLIGPDGWHFLTSPINIALLPAESLVENSRMSWYMCVIRRMGGGSYSVKR